ncbi:tetratricopeptide repeat protein [Bradyrhizobium sp.]|uniref:tetratricopeptide repeat protein n=1 Tax=Bradyrhizobium sp. TaxID=376 RepID=UPI003C67BC83
MLATAVERHRAGNLAEAETYYRKILAIEPDHRDAIQLIGAIAYQRGSYEVAAEWIGRAIKLDRNQPAWFYNLGLSLERLGKLEQALACYDSALALNPRSAEGCNNRGNVLKALNRTDEALASYEQALALNSDYAEALNGRGSLLEIRNRPDDALACYDRALQVKPNYADAFNHRGNALKRLGRTEEALASYEAAVALNPNLVAALNNYGAMLKEMNRFDEALAKYDQALALDPTSIAALNNRGVVLAELGRSDEALSSYGKALALSPDLVPTLTNRGNLLQELGRYDDARADYEKALARDHDCADAVNGLGSLLHKLNRIHEAEKTLRRAILLKPSHADAYCNLGAVLTDLGRLSEAEAAVRRAVELNPESPTALCHLGSVLVELGRYHEAEAVIRRALALKPMSADAHSLLASIHHRLGRPEEAEALSRRAIELKPNFAAAHHNLSVALTELGRLNEAGAAAERAIALAPHAPEYYRQLGDVRKYSAGDPHLAALETLADDEASLDIGKQIDLNFALAKALGDVDRKQDEFRRLLAGNRLKRSRIDYNETFVLGQMDCAQQVFSSEFIRFRRGSGAASAQPIFIVGMPRSGTTLIEQILASHPMVFGAGELTLFERALSEIRSSMHGAQNYPEIALQMTDEQFRELGLHYLAEMRQLAPTASHITDKMPTNFVFAGLIHLALPNATIIHIVRDPVDTCISCFSKLFTEGHSYSYDLAELGRYHRSYAALMRHWHRVLPSGRILDVCYEETVADLEAAARRILAHCGLPWDARCLDFHRTERVVRTSSAAQVRRPIYASSVGRRHAYGALLEPLLAELGGGSDEFGLNRIGDPAYRGRVTSPAPD